MTLMKMWDESDKRSKNRIPDRLRGGFEDGAGLAVVEELGGVNVISRHGEGDRRRKDQDEEKSERCFSLPGRVSLFIDPDAQRQSSGKHQHRQVDELGEPCGEKSEEERRRQVYPGRFFQRVAEKNPCRQSAGNPPGVNLPVAAPEKRFPEVSLKLPSNDSAIIRAIPRFLADTTAVVSVSDVTVA